MLQKKAMDKYKQQKFERDNDCTYGFWNDQKYKNKKKLYLRKNKTWLIKHFCSNPYNNNHDFEQRSKTFQQIQSFLPFNMKHILYFTTGMKFFKTIFTDIQITLFTIITCFLPWLFAIFVCFIFICCTCFSFRIRTSLKCLPLKRKKSMSEGQPGVDNLFAASRFALVSTNGWTISCIKDVESICICDYYLQNLDETSCTRCMHW